MRKRSEKVLYQLVNYLATFMFSKTAQYALINKLLTPSANETERKILHNESTLTQFLERLLLKAKKTSAPQTFSEAQKAARPAETIKM